MAEKKVSLKLLLDKKNNRVLFAEAGKEFVDFLFTIPALPVGTVIRLLKKQGMVGSLGNLYESIESLDGTYMEPIQNKDTLLNPRIPVQVPLLLPNIDSSVAGKMYTCSNKSNKPECRLYMTDVPIAFCPHCRMFMNRQMKYVAPTIGEGGYVKGGVAKYMVMNDLVVKPMSTVSCIAMLSKFNIKEVGDLQEKVVDLGMEEGLKLLSASLQSETVLDDVFLDGKKRAKRSN